MTDDHDRDRVIALDGKHVSLAAIEAQLVLHPFVAQAATTPLQGTTRTHIGAAIVLTAEGNDALIAHGRTLLAKTLRRHLAAHFELSVLPRHWRFRLALPSDARGELLAEHVAATFDARSDGVQVLAEARIGDALHYDLHVPSSLVHFAGHFPGLAILPGVVQVDWAVRLASEQVPSVREVASIDRLKFMAPVPPNAMLKLTMTHDAARHRVQFAFRFNERLKDRDCTSGVIVYKDHA